MVSIAPALFDSANTYLRIVGGACFLNALIPIYSSYLRVFGYTKQSLWASIIGNVINFILNAVFLFVMNWGVMGVATATVISRIINLIIVATMGAVLIKAKDSPERIAPGKILGQIIKIGFPSACETALYNIAMTLVVRFMNQMDADGLNVTARSYATQIANFSYCIGAALAQANAILTGWHIGAKEYDECDRGTRKAAIYGVITASCLSITFALLGNYIVRIFTNDVQMINLVTKLLAIDIVLEFGRVTNLVYGQALKTSGDAVFPVVMGAVFMYLAAVGGTYFFGLHLGLLAVGAYIGLASDECIRAVGMVLRWKSGKWKIRDWLIRANKIKLQYKKEPAGHLNLITLTCWFLFILHLLYYASSGSLYPAFCIALSKSANVIFSLFIEKSLHISHKIFKIYETPTIITLIIENASIFPRDILETNKPIMLIITEIIR